MKTVVITGAHKGIGRATAEKFLAEGWFVAGTASAGKIDINNENFIALELDFFRPGTIEAAAHQVKKLDRPIDVLVNNAGVAYEEKGDGIEIDTLRRTLEVNLIGLADFTNRVLPFMHEGSHIINVSSQAASLTTPEGMHWVVPSYKISKAALNMLTQALGELLVHKHITVSSFDPGWVRTEMGGDEAPRSPEEPAKEIYELANRQIETGNFWRNGSKRSW